MEQSLLSLNSELDSEIISNPLSLNSIAETNNLIYRKHKLNSSHIRQQLIKENVNDPIIKELLSSYTNKITHGSFINNSIIQNHNESIQTQKTRRLSIDFHNIDTQSENEDENLNQLKQRLLQGSKLKSSTLSLDKQLKNEELKQDDILKDMFQFIQGIKDGANLFNEKLNEDQNILKAAEAGLEITSEKLIKSRNNLSKTIQNLSLFDTLKLFALLIFSFLLCLIMIKLLPRW